MSEVEGDRERQDQHQVPNYSQKIYVEIRDVKEDQNCENEVIEVNIIEEGKEKEKDLHLCRFVESQYRWRYTECNAQNLHEGNIPNEIYNDSCVEHRNRTMYPWRNAYI